MIRFILVSPWRYISTDVIAEITTNNSATVDYSPVVITTKRGEKIRVTPECHANVAKYLLPKD